MLVAAMNVINVWAAEVLTIVAINIHAVLVDSEPTWIEHTGKKDF